MRSVELGVCPMQLFLFLITWRSSSSKSAPVYKVSSKSDDFSRRYDDISIFKMAAVCHLEFWKFSFLIRWCSSSSKSAAAVYKILWKSDDFHWDMALYRFSKRRPSAVLELFYTTIRDHQRSLAVAGRSCLSNFMSIWYTDLKNFSHLWLEMPIQAPKMGFGGLWTPKFDHSSSRPPKGTSLHNSASFKLSTVKIRWGVWPEGELTESVMDIHTHAQVNLYSFHALHSIGQTMIPFVFLVPRWWH